MTTRQQRRARARAPLEKKRSGLGFVAMLTVILLAGIAGVVFLRANPPKLTRGALATDHWHAALKLQLCGKPIGPFPPTEGEIHTHGDGQIHVHPKDPAYTGDNANLGAFFQSAESTLGLDDEGKRFLAMPDGKTYKDGDECPDLEGTHELVVLKNDELVEGDPHKLIIHDGDEIVVRFGPEPKPGTPPAPNPLTEMMQQFQQQMEQQQGGAPPGAEGDPAQGGPDGSDPATQPQ
ncbi:MAG TPA: hypothetical protein VM840_00190 [Actinomycetota bacterium]|nr:hypothetical protein [Actinomycetota bacterium]